MWLVSGPDVVSEAPQGQHGPMTAPRLLGVAALVLAVAPLGLLAACGEEARPADATAESAADTSVEEEPAAASSPAESEAPAASATRSARRSPDGTRIVARSSEFGTILVDGTGQAIYLFDVETGPKPACYADCAEAWPPVYTRGTPRAGDQVDQALLGTTRRRDGRRQVTYAGHPLYFYAHEGKGEVECHDVFLNGGTWYAVAPSGDRAP